MKNFPINQKLSGWICIQKKQLIKWGSLFMVLALLNLTLSCQNYFKIRTSNQPTAETITQLNRANKTFILHFDEDTRVLSSLGIKNDSIGGMLEEYYMLPVNKVNPDKANRYITRASNDQRYLLNEVHLYLNDYKQPIDNHILIPISAIDKVEIYSHDAGTTTASYVLGFIGIAAAVVLLIGIVALATDSDPEPEPEPTPAPGGESCPFIYTWDGEKYQFAGEIYSGAIHQPLERNDYLKLPTYPNNQAYSLLVKNEVKEIQHTNLLELFVIDHPENTSVLIDKYGKIVTLDSYIQPTYASNMTGENIMKLIASKDSLFYQSHQTGSEAPLKDAVILQFPSQGKAKSAQLAIHARNSMILDLMMGQFHNLIGSAYDRYVKRQNHASAKELHQWGMDQGMPLSLYVERNNTWEFVDYYNIAGPMKMKEDVISFPLKGNESDPLKIKLEFGNMFWEIDGAWVDYSPAKKVNIQTVPVFSAITEEMKDVAGLLQKDDNRYYTQPTMDNQSAITFVMPELTDQERTVILHSKGWYQILCALEGKPERNQLKAFKEPGHFNRFVNQQMQQSNQMGLKP